MVKSKKNEGASPNRDVIDLSDEDCVLDTSDVEILELNSSAPHEIVTSSQSDSGVECVSQCLVSQDVMDGDVDLDDNAAVSQDTDPIDINDSVESQDSADVIVLDEEDGVAPNELNADIKQQLLRLEEEVQQLKAENENLKSKTCSCQNHNGALIKIIFDTSSSFAMYKDKICKLFKEYINLTVDEQESNLLICINNDDTINANEWVVVDETEEVTSPIPTASDKRKRRRKRKISLEEISGVNNTLDTLVDSSFILDTTPSLDTKRSLKYESKFDIVRGTNKVDEEVPKSGPSTCFNCDGVHNLRDCPHPRDHFKINAARQRFKPHNKSMVYKRYHLECEQRFEDFKPGKLSTKLQEALGLRHNQLPEHIYRMRTLGYPPGWFNEFLAAKESNLVLFDFNGKGGEGERKVQDMDVNKIIDYHGFNIPLRKGFKDEFRLYDAPPYSKELSKSKMVEFIDKVNKDNLTSCEMDIDNTVSDKEIEIINAPKNHKVTSVCPTISPTLVELENKKKTLLDQLTEDVNSSLSAEPKDAESNANDTFVTFDETGSVSAIDTCINETVSEDTLTVEKPLATPILKTIKTTYFGTPLLKSNSPYSQLPHCDNFTKNVSDVINFENLPNSTGKYDEMVVVIEKVRKTLNTKKS